MKIKLGLPGEKYGDFSLSLFGKPKIKVSKNGSKIYVNCHIINVHKDPAPRHDFELVYYLHELLPKTEKKMYYYARKLANNLAKERNLKIKPGDSKYIQNKFWHGFCFDVK